jgi:cysteine synthase A
VTSGNTGIALAAIGAARGYPVKIYASDNISPDKFRLLKHYGAEMVKVEDAFFLDPQALEKIAARIRAENPDAFFTDQPGNPSNPQAHYRTNGPEIWQDTGGTVEAFVAGVGTRGTISGMGRYLKERNPAVHLGIAEPALDSLPNEERPNPLEIDGVHHVTEALPEQLPGNFAREVVDKIIALDPLQTAGPPGIWRRRRAF